MASEIPIIARSTHSDTVYIYVCVYAYVSECVPVLNCMTVRYLCVQSSTASSPALAITRSRKIQDLISALNQ